ncbi:hypothetical protein AF00_05659 [Klebsiella pneumoniae CHS 44]|nr:hypothetical protein AF00_05659 [Klebsiella pneumoniae CHS 44]
MVETGLPHQGAPPLADRTVPDTAEMRLTQPQARFSGFFEGRPPEPQQTATGGHTRPVALIFSRKQVNPSNVVRNASVSVPGRICGGIIREVLEFRILHAHRPILGDGSFDVLSLPYHLCCLSQNRIPTGGHAPERLPSLRGSLLTRPLQTEYFQTHFQANHLSGLAAQGLRPNSNPRVIP